MAKKIMILDSDPDISDLYEEIISLDVEKYVINKIATAEECMEALKKEAKDLILLDIELPDMCGWELIEKIRELEPEVPLVITTAKPPGLNDFSRLATVSDYLMKPVTVDGLQMAVKDALEVPFMLEKCIEAIRNSSEGFEVRCLLEEKYIPLLKESITDRKRFVLMRQLYPDRKIQNDPDSRLMLENLRKKLEKTQNEIESLKNEAGLLFTTHRTF